jgi:cation diffusion facilitator family transporter
VTEVAQAELPAKKIRAIRRAERLQMITIVHVALSGIALFIVAGNSQAMKGTYLDDLMGLFPPTAYLIASKWDFRRPNQRFPYGYHRAQSIAFFLAALALIGVGIYIVAESVLKLIRFEHPSVGLIEIFGLRVWLGVPMLLALAFTAGPQYLLGRLKMPLAEELNDKVLHADAAMNRADWLAASAAGVGVIGIGFGLWWLDPLAAIFIGVEVVEEGVKHTKGVFAHLMSETPTSIDYSRRLPLPRNVERKAMESDWVQEARVRIREEGRVYFGEVFVVPVDGKVSVDDVDGLTRDLYELDWRIQDLVVTIVPDLDIDSHLKGRQE